MQGAIGYNPTTGLFTVFQAGSYEITFGARIITAFTEEEPFDPCPAIALSVNGAVVPGTEVSATFGEEQEGDGDWVELSVIQTVAAGTTFSVVAQTVSGAPIELFNPVDPCNPDNTTAFATIKKL